MRQTITACYGYVGAVCGVGFAEPWTDSRPDRLTTRSTRKLSKSSSKPATSTRTPSHFMSKGLLSVKSKVATRSETSM